MICVIPTPRNSFDNSNASADVVVEPQVAACRVNECVVGQKLLKCDTRRTIDRPAAVARLDLVVLLAIAHNAWHLGLVGASGWCRCSGGFCRSGDARDVDAHVVIEPEVGAFCVSTLLAIVPLQSRVQFGYIRLLTSPFQLRNWVVLMPYFLAMASQLSPEETL